jgi:hypothetical protein
MPASRVSQDQLAVLGSIFDRAGLQTDLRKLRTQSEFMKNSRAMRQQIDAGPEFGDFGRGFHQRHVHAAAMKHERRRQPADSRPDDQNAHAVIPIVSSGSS